MNTKEVKNIAEIREALHRYVETASDRIIMALYTIFEDKIESMGITVSGDAKEEARHYYDEQESEGTPPDKSQQENSEETSPKDE